MVELDGGSGSGGDTTTEDGGGMATSITEDVEEQEAQQDDDSGGMATSITEDVEEQRAQADDGGGGWYGGGGIATSVTEDVEEQRAQADDGDGGGMATSITEDIRELERGTPGTFQDDGFQTEQASSQFDREFTDDAGFNQTDFEFTSDEQSQLQEQREEFAQEIAESRSDLAREDIRVFVTGSSRDELTFEARLTPSARRRLRRRQRNRATETARSQRNRRQTALLTEFALGPAQSLENRRQATVAVERNLERQVGAARADALGISNPTLRQSVMESTDLERGEDFTVSTDGAVVRAELTDEFRQELGTAAAERQLEERTGVDFEPGEDFVANVDDEGRVTVEFTEEGRTKAQTAEVTQAVGAVERTLGVDIPGEGPIAGTTESDLGDTPIMVRAGPEDEFRRFEDVAADAIGDIFEVTRADTVPVLGADRPVTPGRGSAPRPRQPREQATASQEFVVSGAEAAARLPAFPIAATVFAKNVGEFFVEAGERATTGSPRQQNEALRELGSDFGTAAATAAAIGAAGALRDPVRTAGALTGSLLATGGAMGLARGLGGARASLATRAAIQPGEEALGIGGFAATRRVAGRSTAQRLFPNREPLIFSEEAAFMAARRAGRAVDPRGVLRFEASPRQAEMIERFGRREAGPDPDLPGERPQTLSAEAVDEAMGVEGPSDPAVFREEAVGMNLGVARTREVEFDVETESEGDIIRDFDPSRSEVLGGGASERAREQMTERQKEARRQSFGEFEGVEDPIGGAETRLERAQRAEVGVESDVTGEARMRTEAVVDEELGRLNLADRLALLEAERELARPGLDTELDTEFEFESEFEFEAETEAELRAALEAEAEAESEFEFESEFEGEGEGEFEFEAEPEEFPREPGRRGGEAALAIGVSDPLGEDLAPGFLSETFAAFAGQAGRARDAPGQSTLEMIAETGQAPVFELPTAFELENPEAVGDVREQFGLSP